MDYVILLDMVKMELDKQKPMEVRILRRTGTAAWKLFSVIVCIIVEINFSHMDNVLFFLGVPSSFS